MPDVFRSIDWFIPPDGRENQQLTFFLTGFVPTRGRKKSPEIGCFSPPQFSSIGFERRLDSGSKASSARNDGAGWPTLKPKPSRPPAGIEKKRSVRLFCSYPRSSAGTHTWSLRRSVERTACLQSRFLQSSRITRFRQLLFNIRGLGAGRGSVLRAFPRGSVGTKALCVCCPSIERKGRMGPVAGSAVFHGGAMLGRVWIPHRPAIIRRAAVEDGATVAGEFPGYNQGVSACSRTGVCWDV